MYKHVSREERYQIQSLVRAQDTTTEIARLLGRHPSTIGREIKRGRGLKGYRAEQACRKASERASHSRNAKQISTTLWQRIEPYIRCDWSPEQIAGLFAISHETVYLRIYADKAKGGCLHKHLRSQKPRRKRLGAGQDRRGQIPMRVPIALRPASVNSRKHIEHREVYSPWGSFDAIDTGYRYKVKRITVKPGARLSRQLHHHRAEHWVVVRGTAQVTNGEHSYLVTENESAFIPIGQEHCLENPGTIPLELIEVQSGSYLGEDDIVRNDDLYNR